MKKVFLGIVSASLLLQGVTAYADVPRLYVNGNRVNTEIVMKDDHIYVPIRAVSESMGAEVTWDDTTRSAYIAFSEDEAIAKIVEDASPSVVTIVGNYKSGSSADRYNNPTVHGSGVVYKSNGYILTNAHVVEDILNLTVIFSDGTTVPGTVLYSDSVADLAVVKVDRIGLAPIRMADPGTVVSGKTAIAIGTPISLSMRNSVTKGIVSGNGVTLSDSYYKLIQTDTPINPGNSGGPLLNAKGELIGITSSKFVGGNIDSIGFAIPVDTVAYAIRQFETFGKIIRADFGLALEESWEARIGLPTPKGLTVKSSKNSALQNGDVIHSVNGISVHSIADWNEALKSTYNGITAEVVYERSGREEKTLISQ